VAGACRLAAPCLAVILKGSSCLPPIISTSRPYPLLYLYPFSHLFRLIFTMNPAFNQFNGGLLEGEAEDPTDVALSPPSTPSYQKKNLPPLPFLSEWPPPLERPRRLSGTPTPIASFESLPNAELTSLSLLSIGDTGDYISTSATHSRVHLADSAVEELTDTAVTFDIASPRASHDSVSHQKDNIPLLPPLKEWPEQPQPSVGTATLISSSEPFHGLSSLPIPPVADRSDYNPTAATNSRIPPSDVAVDLPAHPDITITIDIPPPCADQDLSERSSRENGNGYMNTSYGGDDALPSPHPVELLCDDNNPIEQSFPLTRPCWSEDAEEDLVTHLGPSERSRQEMMWEIVKSEER
jgi:hypothetical protein